MKALVYLTCTRLKNAVKNFFRSPGRIVLAVFMAAMFVLLLLTGGAQRPTAASRPLSELTALVLGFYFLMFFLLARAGLSNGASFFSMADVNLLFTGPFSTRSVLLYGLVRQLGTTFLMAFFLLYQYGWLNQAYGIGLVGLVAILLGYMLTVYCSQLVAMGIYAWTSADDRRRSLVSRLLYLYVLAVLAALAAGVFSAQDKLAALVAAANARWVDFLPVAGWLRAFAAGLMGGDWARMALGLGAVAVFVAAFTWLVSRADADYYEDVLAATETAQSALAAKQEGRVAETTPRNVKVGREGIGRGAGASVFFWKHRLESRRSRVLLLDTLSLVTLAVTAGMAYFLRETGILGAFFMSLYMMLFTSFNSRWARELTKPYVYLVPESSFRKLVAVCGESILKSAAESLLLMAVAGVIVGAPVPLIAACAFCRFCAALLLIAADVLSDRLFGAIGSRSLKIMLFLLGTILLAIPGIIAAALLGSLADSLALGVAAAGVWMLLVSLLILFLCRNVLDNAELNA